MWKLEVVGYSSLNEGWVKKASECVSNKSTAYDQLEVDDSDLVKLFSHLKNNGFNKFMVYAVEKRIVLPPSAPTTPCPTCSGTGEIK